MDLFYKLNNEEEVKKIITQYKRNGCKCFDKKN